MQVTQRADVGVIGGSGLGTLAGAQPVEELEVDTPFGAPSGPFVISELAGHRVAFLARHGPGHRWLPSEINYRANVWGFRKLGVERLVSLSAVGSLREGIEPRHLVLVDQFIDRTRGRASTFFGDGVVAHVSLADPTCPQLRPLAEDAARSADLVVHPSGTYLCMEGPQFSTRAESHLHRGWGADVVGMTNATEAKLAREAELCYATIALVTDHDCWHESEESVTVETLLGHLKANAEAAGRLLERWFEKLPSERACPCGSALSGALITDPSAIGPELRGRLGLLLDPHL